MKKDKTNTKVKGNKGEQLAVDFLLNIGYTVLDRNFRSGKAEIDIIAKDNNFIVFIEVKSRTVFKNETPRDLLSNSQQKRIIEAAHNYIIDNDINEEARFDFISVTLDQQNKIEHIKDAFYPTL